MSDKGNSERCKPPPSFQDKLYVKPCGWLKEIDDQSIDLILTDPPYGTTGHGWDKAPDWPTLLESFARVLKPNGQLAVFGTLTSLSELLFADRTARKLSMRFELAWLKNQGMYFSPKKPIRRHETIAVLANRAALAKDLVFNVDAIKTPGKPYRSIENRRTHGWKKQIGKPYLKENADGRRWPISCLEVKAVGGSSREYMGHPAQKPLRLMEWLVIALTQPGQRILDPFAGVGSGWEAARRNDRAWIGYETDRKFAQRALQRMKTVEIQRKAL